MRRARNQFRDFTGRFARPRSKVSHEFWNKVRDEAAASHNRRAAPTFWVMPVLRLTGDAAEEALLGSGVEPPLAEELADTSVLFTREGRNWTYVPTQKGLGQREVDVLARQVDDLIQLQGQIAALMNDIRARRAPTPWPLVKLQRAVGEAVVAGRANLLTKQALVDALPGEEAVAAADEKLARRLLQHLQHERAGRGDYAMIVGLDPDLMTDPTVMWEAPEGAGTISVSPAALAGVPVARMRDEPVPPTALLERQALLGDAAAAEEVVKRGPWSGFRPLWNGINGG